MAKYNKSKPSKIIVVVGPTASGKSDLGVHIARKVQGEVISADSRQVYRGMDIGTGKITKKEMQGVPHYLLDVVSPKDDFNVSHFKKFAVEKITKISGRGHIPIIVGGTGLWIDALIYDWPIPEIGPDRTLRTRLEKLPTDKLFSKLQKLDSARANNIDRFNRRRLIRALEIVITTGEPVPRFDIAYKSELPFYETKIQGKNYEVLTLGINLPKAKLEERIHRRLIQRLKGGMIREIKKLHESGVSWKRLDNFGLEYRYCSRYLRGRTTYDQMIGELFHAIKGYAKRQMTWFSRDKNIKWLSQISQADALLRSFLKNADSH